MLDWFHNSPFWIWGSILVTIAVLVSLIGLITFRRLAPGSVLDVDNDVVSGTMSIVGIAYAILTALIAAATWQSLIEARNTTEVEASRIASLYRDAEGLPPQLTQQLRQGVAAYIRKVIGTEWPAQQRGDISRAAREDIDHIHSLIVAFDPAPGRETVVQAEFLRGLNELYNARNSRQIAARSSIPNEIWGIMVFGAMLTIVCTYLFRIEDFRKHIAITGVVSASMALVIVLILALDSPFRGDMSISTDAYHNAIENVRRVHADTKAR